MSELKDKADFATQAGHWYRTDGTPAYTIIGKNGKERNTTIRDAREHGLLPSVTTILKLAAAPGLERWKIQQAVKSALELVRGEGESVEDFTARIIKDSGEKARLAAEKGIAIHGAIEKQDKWGQYAEHVIAAYDSVNAWVGTQPWDMERSFASRLGFGGKLDLSAPGFVVDYKTTDKPLADLKTWEDHRRQLAAYRMGLDMPDARCAICYVSSVKPEARVIELDQAELARGWREFEALLQLWKAMKE